MKSDGVYKKTQRTIQKEYNDTLQSILRKNRDYLKKVNQVQSGKIKPPSGLKTEAQVEAWKRGYLRRYLAKTEAVNKSVKEMQDAGVRVRKSIRDAMNKTYGIEHGSVVDALRAGRLMKPPTERQAAILLDGKLQSFDIQALRNLSNGDVARKRLQREFAASIVKGESDEAVIKRIQKVTGMEESHAKTVLRTERTRVIGMAQQDASEEYTEKTGRVPKKRWKCMFRNSRESHVGLHNHVVRADEEFLPGLAFPGDPRAPARETVNCQCHMEVFDDDE